jgi:ubiquinone/menaquinone biosynthesis C-methylase UbiE/uncharacterized protein YbaR (Trm112 family)
MEEILRCPVTGSGLKTMADEQLNQLNRRVISKELQHLDGTPVQRPLTQALVSEGGQFAYIVEDGIMMLLAPFAIVLNPALESGSHRYQLREEKKVVKDWYDQFGWQTGEGGLTLDAISFGDLRPVSEEYGHKTQLRPLKYLQKGGKYILDVASGAIPQPEYLQYSEPFEKRICIDLSFVALQQCKKKLGNKGIYILGDITNLPLQNDVCDAVISLHTIYHVPGDEQLKALTELYRVLKPGGIELMIYNWGTHALIVRLAEIPLSPVVLNTVHAIQRVFGRKREAHGASQASSASRPARGLYFHAHTYKWFKNELSKFCRFDMVCWRAVDQRFLDYYIRERFFGRTLLKLIYWWEEKFPRLAARLGKFPMFIIRKPNSSSSIASSRSHDDSRMRPVEPVEI